MWLERLYDEFTTPTRGRPDPRVFHAIMFVALGLLVCVVGGVFAAMTGQGVAFFAVGFVFLAVGAFALLATGLAPGRKAAKADRVCPKCGAPPGGVLSAHGLAKCAQCGEHYFVS